MKDNYFAKDTPLVIQQETILRQAIEVQIKKQSFKPVNV